MNTPSPLYRVDTLITADLDGLAVTVPALKVLDKDVTPLIFAKPSLQLDERNYVTGIEQDIKAWLIWDPFASTLPIRCGDQNIALACAKAFIDASTSHELRVRDPIAVLAWCSKWIRDHSGVDDFTGPTQALDLDTGTTQQT
ncbi:hypothetical protein ACVDFE_00260 [Lentzea chajnantorensis]